MCASGNGIPAGPLISPLCKPCMFHQQFMNDDILPVFLLVVQLQLKKMPG
jgi:hypothetical protein